MIPAFLYLHLTPKTKLFQAFEVLQHIIEMVEQTKIVRDAIHGNIPVDHIFNQLLETPEIQRLYNIKQLGLAHLVFPGAHHTRLEHSLGTYYLAYQATQALHLKKDESTALCIAALLHDIGHGPFSHTLESILWQKFGVNHIDLTSQLIAGTYDIFNADEKELISTETVQEVLTNEGINIQHVINIIENKERDHPYLGQFLTSSVDVDQLDYLIRDAHYTGVAYGMIDIPRLFQTLCIHDNQLAIQRKGVSVVENILMARGLMYTSVYFHKTVRIAELMLSKAFELLPDPDPFLLFRMTDAEIMETLRTMGRYQHEIVTRLKYRKLFKQAYMLSLFEADESMIQMIQKLEDFEIRRKQEESLEDFLGIPSGQIIIDVPRPELLRAEPRINQTDINVIEKNTKRSLDVFTPIARALRERIAPDWCLMIITDERYRSMVSEKAPGFLFS
ncbi:MAG: HD domain-containing protein [Candidatus Thermoplasmatota archaeon]|nr:HD domain-containing protein [Candidatus Thermoplasmatota archaeon]